MQYSQEHLKTMVYAEFGGQTECIMGNWKIENASHGNDLKRLVVLKTPRRNAWDWKEQPVWLVNLEARLLVLCQLSHEVIGYEDTRMPLVRYCRLSVILLLSIS